MKFSVCVFSLLKTQTEEVCNDFGQAHKGYTEAMYRLGVFYYFGLRGVHRDHSKALTWLLKAVEKSDARSMELLGEIYARGYGVERNYSRAYEWFLEAARKKHYSALNGIGYLYVKGQGVADGKNHTMVKLLTNVTDNCEI